MVFGGVVSRDGLGLGRILSKFQRLIFKSKETC